MTPANILVTGANRGVGYGLAKKFLDQKDVKRVFATARRPEEAIELKELAASDLRLIILQLDVSCDKSIEAAYDEVQKIVGEEGLTLLINNSGILLPYPHDKPDRVTLTKQLDVNTVSPIIITQYFLPLIQKAAARISSKELSASRAAVVNISSIGGSISFNDPKNLPPNLGEIFPPLLAYRASKSAMNSITKNFANDLRDDGILVVCFCPGWVKTDMGGKEQGQITIDESASALVETILKLGTEQTGGYFHRTGEVIPY